MARLSGFGRKRPRIISGKEIWCATRKSSEKVKQLKKVSYAEYCFCDKEGRHVRLGGPSTISTDNDEKLKLYKSLPELAKYIQNPASPAYVVIKTKPKRIRFMAADDMEYKEVKIGS